MRGLPIGLRVVGEDCVYGPRAVTCRLYWFSPEPALVVVVVDIAEKDMVLC